MTNILNFDEYRADGGTLDYGAYIQCLIDSGNLTKEVGEMQINLRCEILMAKIGFEWNGERWVYVRGL